MPRRSPTITARGAAKSQPFCTARISSRPVPSRWRFRSSPRCATIPMERDKRSSRIARRSRRASASTRWRAASRPLMPSSIGTRHRRHDPAHRHPVRQFRALSYRPHARRCGVCRRHRRRGEPVRHRICVGQACRSGTIDLSPALGRRWGGGYRRRTGREAPAACTDGHRPARLVVARSLCRLALGDGARRCRGADVGNQWLGFRAASRWRSGSSGGSSRIMARGWSRATSQAAYLRDLGLREEAIFRGYNAVDNDYFAQAAAGVVDAGRPARGAPWAAIFSLPTASSKRRTSFACWKRYAEFRQWPQRRSGGLAAGAARRRRTARNAGGKACRARAGGACADARFSADRYAAAFLRQRGRVRPTPPLPSNGAWSSTKRWRAACPSPFPIVVAVPRC